MAAIGGRCRSGISAGAAHSLHADMSIYLPAAMESTIFRTFVKNVAAGFSGMPSGIFPAHHLEPGDPLMQ